MIAFERILGQEAAVALLRAALAAGRLPHALLFQGPESVGKGTVARTLAAALLCDGGGEDPCGACGPCRRVAQGSHPDLLVVERLPKKPGASGGDDGGEEGEDRGERRSFILVGQVRELSDHAAYAPREGRRRVFVIDPADRMNGEAQNALLKTLEEPAGRAVLILVASRPHLLLPTVRSRCLAIRFAAMPVAALAEALRERGMPREEALARAALSGGRPGRALTLDPQRLEERRESLLAALEALSGGAQAALAELSALAGDLVGSDEDALLEGIDLCEGLLRDAALAAGGGPREALQHADLARRLEALGDRISPARASALLAALDRLRGELRFNLNRTLLAESFFAAVAGGPIP